VKIHLETERREIETEKWEGRERTARDRGYRLTDAPLDLCLLNQTFGKYFKSGPVVACRGMTITFPKKGQGRPEGGPRAGMHDSLHEVKVDRAFLASLRQGIARLGRAPLTSRGGRLALL
jgi:hypothetical protein